MCGGMKYIFKDSETGLISERKVYFPRPHALIPAIEGQTESLCQWGRRSEKEDPDSGMPITGWARLEKLEDSYWQRFEPQKVLIPALEFCEKPEGFDKSLWYPPLRQQTFLMGLKLAKADKTFVYVVTTVPERIFRDIDRVPVIVDAGFKVQKSIDLDSQEQLDLFNQNFDS